MKSFSQSKFGHTGRVQDPALLRSEGLKIIQAAMAACEPCIDITYQAQHYAPSKPLSKAKSLVTSHCHVLTVCSLN